MNYNVIIIGAGPIGLACGVEAVKHGLSYLIIEKGCVVNSIFNYPTNMTFFSTSEKIEIGDVPFVSHGIKPTRREALEYYRRVAEAYELNVKTFEKVLAVENSDNLFRVTTSKGEYNSFSVIIASGYYDNPNLMEVSGEALPKVKHYFDEPHPYSGLRTVVIGAGNSAVDVALELFRVGAKVTMIIREDSIKPSIKYWVKPDIENRIAEGSIKAFFNSTVEEINAGNIVINSKERRRVLPNDVVFAMTGYHPDFGFLRECGIKIKNGRSAIFRKSNMESNVPGLYLAGVVCNGSDTDKHFIENSIIHSRIIMKDIAKNLKKS